MKVIPITNYNPHKILEELSEALKVKLIADCLEHKIVINNNVACGEISGFTFSDGIGLLLFNFKSLIDWTILFQSTTSTPSLLFSFIENGRIAHIMNNGLIAHTFKKREQSITANPTGKEEQVKFFADFPAKFTLITIDRFVYAQKMSCYLKQLPSKIQYIFNDTAGKDIFSFRCPSSLGSLECILAIRQDLSRDIIRSNFVEGNTLELLSKMIWQQRLHTPNVVIKQVYLSQDDIENITALREYLHKNYANPPTIQELAKIGGLNQSKLKAGFKRIYNETIKEFIVKLRLKKAKNLLLQNKLSIKEIAHQVGYINTGYFTKIFKQRYNVLPKDYAKYIADQITIVKETSK